MNFDDLRLPPGTLIQLQFIDDSRERYPSRLIGHVEGRSILVTHPVHEGRLIRVRGGQRVIARAMTSSAAVAFSGNVETICSAPFHYLHLDYPEAVSINRIRRSPRLTLTMDATLANLSEIPRSDEKPARILDISPTGARIEVDAQCLKIGDEITLAGLFQLSEIERAVNLSGLVRTRATATAAPAGMAGPDVAIYGIEFHSITEDVQLFLQAFVYQKLMEGGA